MFAELDRFAARYREAVGAPALAFALGNRDELVWEGAHGHADAASGRRAHPDDAYEWASIGKILTATALLQLQEEGRFDAARPLADFLADFRPPATAPVTGHHVLTHTAGIAGAFTPTPSSRAHVLALEQSPLRAVPGKSHHYSNTGYRALGFAVEELRSEPYPRVLTERVLGPAGMVDSFAPVDHDRRPTMATGHEAARDDRIWRPGEPIQPARWIEYRNGEGACGGPVRDLCALLRVFLRDGRGDRGRVLAADSVAKMCTPHVAAAHGRPELSEGYGGLVIQVEGVPHWGRGGESACFRAAAVCDPAAGFAAAAAVNGPTLPPIPVVAFALSCARANARGQAPPAAPELPVFPIEPAKPDRPARPGHPLAGVWRSHNPWVPRIVVDEGAAGPELRAPGLVAPLRRVADGTYRLGDSPEWLRFAHPVDERPQSLDFSGCTFVRVDG